MSWCCDLVQFRLIKTGPCTSGRNSTSSSQGLRHWHVVREIKIIWRCILRIIYGLQPQYIPDPDNVTHLLLLICTQGSAFGGAKFMRLVHDSPAVGILLYLTSSSFLCFVHTIHKEHTAGSRMPVQRLCSHTALRV
eukprot:s1719_g16.t1